MTQKQNHDIELKTVLVYGFVGLLIFGIVIMSMAFEQFCIDTEQTIQYLESMGYSIDESERVPVSCK